MKRPEMANTERQREVVYAKRQHEVVHARRKREVVHTRRKREVVHTKRKRELIKTRVDAYYDQHQEARGLTWAGLCDEIFDLTKVQVRHEVLRQWVEGFIAKYRKSPIHPNEAELKAIASFLMHPDINMLSKKELNEPEIPYRFAAFLLDSLAYPGHKQDFPPLALSGTYLACPRAEDGRMVPKVLGLKVREGDHVIRISERSFLVDARFDDANGWGVITPEDNLFIFLKNERSGKNHYYFTMASYPSLWSDTSLCQFALLRHGHPVPDDCTNKYLDELMDDTDEETVLLHFTKIT
jgi:hypothetical protein